MKRSLLVATAIGSLILPLLAPVTAAVAQEGGDRQERSADRDDLRAALQAERAEGVPSPFTKIHLKFLVSGKGLKENQVHKAVELSATKYCSASIMLESAGVQLSHSVEIIEAEV